MARESSLRAALALCTLLAAAGARADAPPDMAAYDAKATAELEARDVEAAKIFRQANAVRQSDPAGASSLYGKVLERVPDFDHALRRKCQADVQLGVRDPALALCRKALAVRRSPENLQSLALALVHGSGASIDDNRNEALALADEATRLAPNDVFAHASRCQVAIAAGDIDRLRASSVQLQNIAFDQVETHLCTAFLAMMDQRWEAADAEIDRLEKIGAPKEMVANLRRIRRDADAHANPWKRPLTVLVTITGIWAVGLLLLVLAGWWASSATLRVLSKRPEAAVGEAERRLRSAYRVIVSLCAAYFYLSLPLVAVFVVGMAAAVVLLFLYLGFIPVKLLIIVGLVTLFTLYATLRSVFARVRDEPPGLALQDLALGEHQRLRALLDEVAEKIGTRVVDEVRLTVGTDLAVTERLGSLGQLRRERKRTLIIGIALLEGLTVHELRSLLAHEHGHFRNEDTAGGGLALAVRRSILLMVVHLAQSGAATAWNPAWWFVRGYLALFLRVSQGASRLQEVLADRWAVLAYGSKPFRRGLRHVIRRSVEFESHLARSIADATSAAKAEKKARKRGDADAGELAMAITNLYQHVPRAPADDDKIEDQYLEQLDAPPSPYDSHPSPRERLAAAKAMSIEVAGGEGEDEQEAWSLFDDQDGIEERMTDEVSTLLLRQGITLRALAAGDALKEA